MKVPMLIPLISIIGGIIAADYGCGPLTAGILFAIGVVIYLTLLTISKGPLLSYRYSRFHVAWVILLFAGIGIITADFNRPFRIENDSFSGYSAAKGKIIEISSRTSGDRIIMDVESLIRQDLASIDCPNFKAVIYSDAVTKDIDDIITVPAKFSRIKNPQNTFFSGYAEGMARKGIYYYARIPDVDIHFIGHGNSFSGITKRFRNTLVAHIENTGLSKDTQNFLITILLGDRAYQDSETRESFAGAGVAHVLALSGMHLAIISGIILFLLFPMNFYGLYKYRLLMTVVLLWGYTVISGMSPSTVRACIMLTMMAASVWLERKNSSFGALCVATFLILLLKPYSLFDVGLQLSFACVASLLLLAPPLNRIDHRAHPRLFAANEMVIATVVITFTTWIISAYYFKLFPAMFLPANLICLPLLPPYLIISVVYLFAVAIGLDLPVFALLLDKIYDGFIGFIDFLSSGINGAVSVDVPGVAVILWLAACLLLAFCVYNGFTRIRKYSVYSLFAVSLAAMIVLAPEKANGFILSKNFRNVEITYADHGVESTIIPPERSITGYNLHDCRIIVVDKPIDSGIGTKTCDYLVITSRCKGLPDSLDSLVRMFKPHTVILHTSIRRQKEERIIERLKELGIPFHSLRKDGIFRKDCR